jgi:hypothetical protein
MQFPPSSEAPSNKHAVFGRFPRPDNGSHPPDMGHHYGAADPQLAMYIPYPILSLCLHPMHRSPPSQHSLQPPYPQFEHS